MPIRTIARFVDRALTELQLRTVGEQDALVVFLFHTVFESTAEISLNQVDPVLGLERAKISELIRYFQRHHYTFVTPQQVLDGLPDGKFALITFDDGYFNNLRILPVLEELNVPALFFISTDHVRNNRAFWWDVVYRHGIACGDSNENIGRLTATLKKYTHDEIENQVIQRFGEDALTPVSDLDRPLTPEELQQLAGHELAHIGNHTSHHALLTNYDEQGIRGQVRQAQDDLFEMIGQRPRIISYPNGFYDKTIGRISQEEGLDMGIIVHAEKNRLPLPREGLGRMEIKRFMISNVESITAQWLRCRSDMRFVRRVQKLLGMHSL